MQKNSAKKRVFVCGMLQESNSFNPVFASFEDFQSSGIYEGEALIHAHGQAGPTIEGMIQGVSDQGFVPVGGVRMRSKSGGPVDQTVVDWFMKKTLSGLEEAGEIAGVLVSLHGATQSNVSDDVCGDILTQIRNLVGPEVVIAASCDLHANCTERMARAADFICGYQTYPHLDFFEVGYRAATLAARKINGEALKTARAAIPMMAPAHGYSTTRGELQELMCRGSEMVRSGQIADFSVFQVQPWLDVETSSSVVLVTAKDEQTAMDAASELIHAEFALRESLQGDRMWTVPEVIAAALKNREDRPVILVDSADSPNAGACGDSAAVLEELLPHRDSLRAAFSLNDAPAVEKAFSMGVGASGDFQLGAALAPKLSRPVLIKDAVVRSLHDGDFYLGGPAERGQRRSLGRSAVLQAGQIMILVTIRGQNNGDLQFYRSFGIEPTLCRLVCVKACSSFRAGYEPIAALICNTVTPGAACPVLSELPFEKLPKPFYPFQEIAEEMISGPACYR